MVSRLLVVKASAGYPAPGGRFRGLRHTCKVRVAVLVCCAALGLAMPSWSAISGGRKWRDH
jgi:hypothetical protein